VIQEKLLLDKEFYDIIFKNDQNAKRILIKGSKERNCPQTTEGIFLFLGMSSLFFLGEGWEIKQA